MFLFQSEKKSINKIFIKEKKNIFQVIKYLTSGLKSIWSKERGGLIVIIVKRPTPFVRHNI